MSANNWTGDHNPWMSGPGADQYVVHPGPPTYGPVNIPSVFTPPAPESRPAISYPRIMAEIAGQYWAVKPEVLRAVIDIVQGETIDGRLLHATERKDFHAYVADRGDRLDGTKNAYRVGNIGVLEIYGPMAPRASFFDAVSGGVQSIESLASDFRVLSEHRRVDNIVMLMDSPGGAVTGTSEFATQVAESPKPVHGHIVGMAASAMYWIGSQVESLTSVDTGIAGSIGVVATIEDRSEANEKRGIKIVEVTSDQSPRKRTDLMSEEGQSELQAVLNGMADSFIEAVARGRGVDAETVLADFGQGGEFIATAALERGMIDGIMTTGELFSSLENRPQSLFGAAAKTVLAQSGEHDNQEDEMTKKTEPTQAVEPVAPQIDVEKERADAASEAQAAERKRMQDIEAVKADFADLDPKSKEAACAAVDAEKFEPDATPDSIRVKAQAAAIAAQQTLLASARAPRVELGEQLAEVPNAADADQGGREKNEASTARANNITVGFNNHRDAHRANQIFGGAK